MQIKKFEENSMREALKKIKNEFGPEAVILSVRKIENDKGIFSLTKSNRVEVTAAMDAQTNQKTQNNPQNLISKYYGSPDVRPNYQESKKKNSFIQTLRQGAVNYGKRSISPKYENRFKNKGTKELFKSYCQMLEQDVDNKIAIELVKEIKKYIFSESYLLRTGFKHCLIQRLKDMGVDAARVKLGGKKQKIIALIGPTGVGKTSAIAKLTAAAMTRKKKQDVALITLDSDRIGAIEQLKLYGKILGCPVSAAFTKKDLKKHLKVYENYNIVFIDTPGMSPKNMQHMKEIKDAFDTASDMEFHLVLNAATNDKTLKYVLDKYKLFNVNRLMFTKLDECITFGRILNQLYRTKIPATYFTTGPRIPEDIEAATIDKLMDKIFDENNMQKYLTGSPEVLARNIIRFENMIHGTDDPMAIIETENSRNIPQMYSTWAN